jgi:hypothetical protein
MKVDGTSVLKARVLPTSSNLAARRCANGTGRPPAIVLAGARISGDRDLPHEIFAS